jgi:hypothetical protein
MCACLVRTFTNRDPSHAAFGFVLQVFRKQGESLRCGLLCPNASCSATFTPSRLCNLMTMEARKYIGRYYDGHLVCGAMGAGSVAVSSSNAQFCVRHFHLLTPHSLLPFCLQMTRRVAVATARRSSSPFWDGTASTRSAVVPCTPFTPTSSCIRSCPTLSTSLTCLMRWTRSVPFKTQRGLRYGCMGDSVREPSSHVSAHLHS